MNCGRRLIVRCFIAQLDGIDGHAVYLAIDALRARKLGNKEVELRVVSIHSRVVEAWSVAVSARRILENSSYSYKHSNEIIVKTFVAALVADYCNHSSDSVLDKVEAPRMENF